MAPVSPEGTKFENPSELLQGWVQRLREKEPIDTLRDNPIMEADDRELSQIEDSLGKLKQSYEEKGPAATLDPDVDRTRRELGESFSRRQQYLEDLSGGAVKPFSRRLSEFANRSGADIKNLNVQDFGGLLHETISHDLPYQQGFAPDYSNKQIRGYTIPSSSISPLNERLASSLDASRHYGTTANLKDAFLNPREDRLENFYRAQGEYAAAMSDVNRPSYTSKELESGKGFSENLKRFQDESIRSNPFFEIRNRLLRGEGTASDARAQLDLDEASKLFDWKFTRPLTERWENLGKVQAPSSISKDFLPSWSNAKSLLYGYPGEEGLRLAGTDPRITGFTRMLNLGQNLNQYATNQDITAFGGGNKMLFGVDPAGAALSTATKLVKTNPKGAATGVALSALNPDVAKAVEKDDYATAGSIVARDTALGALTEQGIKAAAPVIQSKAPAVAAALTPALRLVNPAVTGTALFAEGREGSLTDVITKKAAAKPISWLPAAGRVDPSTHAGARASRYLANEGQYIWNQLTRGRIPYFNYK